MIIRLSIVYLVSNPSITIEHLSLQEYVEIYFSGNYWIMLSPWNKNPERYTTKYIYTPKDSRLEPENTGPPGRGRSSEQKKNMFRVDSLIFGGCAHSFLDFPCTNWCSTCWSIFTKQLQGFTMNDPDIKGMHSYMLAEHHLGTGKGTLRFCHVGGADDFLFICTYHRARGAPRRARGSNCHKSNRCQLGHRHHAQQHWITSHYSFIQIHMWYLRT